MTDKSDVTIVFAFICKRCRSDTFLRSDESGDPSEICGRCLDTLSQTAERLTEHFRSELKSEEGFINAGLQYTMEKDFIVRFRNTAEGHAETARRLAGAYWSAVLEAWHRGAGSGKDTSWAWSEALREGALGRGAPLDRALAESRQAIADLRESERKNKAIRDSARGQ